MTTPTDRTDPPMAEPGKRKATRGSTGATSNDEDEDEDEWRHEPVAPIDEGNPLKSLGKAVGDTVTGSSSDASTSTPTAKPTPTPAPTRIR